MSDLAALSFPDQMDFVIVSDENGLDKACLSVNPIINQSIEINGEKGDGTSSLANEGIQQFLEDSLSNSSNLKGLE